MTMSDCVLKNIIGRADKGMRLITKYLYLLEHSTLPIPSDNMSIPCRHVALAISSLPRIGISNKCPLTQVLPFHG